jgi:AraC-like DNA-binding protein
MLPSAGAVEYTESAPPPQLASTVRCVWRLDGHARDLNAAIQLVLPDGCPELVVHLGDAFERVHAHGLVERQPAVLVAGQLTSQLSLRATGRIAVVGIRFHPDGAAALLRVPQHDLAGLTVGVDELPSPLARSLRDVRDSTETTSVALSTILERLLVHAPAARVDVRVRRAVEIIGRQRGRVSIDRLARHVGLTRRHLERRFQMLVGMPPKRLARIARFQNALRMLHALDAGQRGTTTAVECGYADQAHFVREFRELAGCPPEAHLLRDAALNGFFSGQPQRAALLP